MVSKIDVNKKVYDSELNQLKNEFEEVEQQLKVEKRKTKKKELEAQYEVLRNKYDSLNKNSRLKEYKRKSESLGKRLSAGAFFSQKGKNAKEILLTKEQACIYFVLIRLAAMHNSWVSVWCNEGLDSFDSHMIVDLYEYIHENIYYAAGITAWGQSPYIDQWLQVLDIELDYSNSKRICMIENALEEIRKEGMGINHQINYGSIICCNEEGNQEYAVPPFGPVDSAVPKDVDPFAYDKFGTEEQYLSGIENLLKIYLKSVKQNSKKILEWALDYGKISKEINEANEEDANIETDESPDMETLDFDTEFPEYRQRNNNLIKYIKSETPTVMKTLEEKKLTVHEAIELINYI